MRRLLAGIIKIDSCSVLFVAQNINEGDGGPSLGRKLAELLGSSGIEHGNTGVGSSGQHVPAVRRKRQRESFQQEVAVLSRFFPGGGVVPAKDGIIAGGDQQFAVRTDGARNQPAERERQ